MQQGNTAEYKDPGHAMCAFLEAAAAAILQRRLAPRERAAVNYSQKLKEKFQHHPQIRRIAHHRHLPKSIYHETKELRTMKEARRRKERNVRKHSKPGSVPVVSEKEKHVVTVLK